MSLAQLESYRGSEAGTVKGPYLMIAGASDPRLAERRNAVLISWTFNSLTVLGLSRDCYVSCAVIRRPRGRAQD